MDLVLLGLDRPIEVHRHLAAGQGRLDLADVEDRRLGAEVFLIARGEGGAEAADAADPLLLAAVLDQGLLEVVLPGAGGLAQALLQGRQVDLGDPARRGLHDQVQAGQDGVGHMRVEGRDLALEGARDQLLEAQPQAGVEAVARHVDQAGDEALEGVPAQEQGDALALLQVQDAHRDVVQLALADLEQLVARKGLQDVQQRLAVMAARIEAGEADRVGDLLAQHRDRHRAAGVGDRGQQADEEPFAGHLALGVEALDRDGVQVDPAVHRRHPVRLGDPEQRGFLEEVKDVLGHRALGPEPVEDIDLLVAQQAAAAVRRHRRDRLVAAPALEDVLAVAEVGEVVVVEPLEEGQALLDLLLRQRRRALLELGDDALAEAPHLLPVVDRRADVGEHPAEALLDLLVALRRLLGDLDVHQGFADRRRRRLADVVQGRKAALGIALGGHDRVDDQVDLDVEPVQLRGHGVDQEGHVVVHDLHDRVGRAPAVLLESRAVGPDPGRAGRAFLGEAPDRQGRAVEVVDGDVGQVDRRHVGIEPLDEGLDRGPAVGVHALPDPLQDPIQKVDLKLFRPCSHDLGPPEAPAQF